MKKVALFTITTAAILAFMGSFFCRSAAAAEKQSGQYDFYCRSQYLDGIGDINRRQKISINSIENPIYCTFENRQKNDEIIKYTNRMLVSNNTRQLSQSQTLSSVIDKGDFIASDKANDGNWDHMGFVTNKDNTYRYYSNGDYYNYEVAQHTEGYIKWADKNGWPMTGGALGRVRR